MGQATWQPFVGRAYLFDYGKKGETGSRKISGGRGFFLTIKANVTAA
jgi:hypothetical protein